MPTKLPDAVDDVPAHPEENWAKKEFGLLLHRLEQLPASSRARLQSTFAQRLLSETMTTETPRGTLSFVLLGRAAGGRALSVLTKQPATIAWINSFQPGSVFWDVGANIGAYALYAALDGHTQVVAIEPAAVNYFLLAANCEINGLDRQVQALLLGLGAERSVSRLEVSQFEPARSFSFRGKRDHPWAGRQSVVILSMDDLVENYGVACPNYVKIDAPGMTEAILAGARRTLARPDVRELHIEVKPNSLLEQRIVAMLEPFGFGVARHDSHGSADITFSRLAS